MDKLLQKPPKTLVLEHNGQKAPGRSKEAGRGRDPSRVCPSSESTDKGRGGGHLS